MSKFFISKILIILIVILLAPIVSVYSMSLEEHPKVKKNNTFPLPFTNFNLLYHLKARIDNLPIPIVNFNVSYINSNLSIQNQLFDFIGSIRIHSSTLLDLGIPEENATFFENSKTRKFFLNSTNGEIIAWLLNLIYDSGTNSNWTPFWINPIDLAQNNQQNQTVVYPIYNFNFTLEEKKSTLTAQDFPIFNTTHPVLIFNTNQYEYRSNSTLEHEIALVYDNYTGILIKGLLMTNLTQNGIKRVYLLDFELAKTNGFSVFPPILSVPSISTILPRPNYLLVLITFFLPIGVILYKLFRLKIIKGGVE